MCSPSISAKRPNSVRSAGRRCRRQRAGRRLARRVRSRRPCARLRPPPHGRTRTRRVDPRELAVAMRAQSVGNGEGFFGVVAAGAVPQAAGAGAAQTILGVIVGDRAAAVRAKHRMCRFSHRRVPSQGVQRASLRASTMRSMFLRLLLPGGRCSRGMPGPAPAGGWLSFAASNESHQSKEAECKTSRLVLLASHTRPGGPP